MSNLMMTQRVTRATKLTTTDDIIIITSLMPFPEQKIKTESHLIKFKVFQSMREEYVFELHLNLFAFNL